MERFLGHKKTGDWFFAKAEKKFVDFITPKVPHFIETYHLTLLTIVWCTAIVFFSFKARTNIHFMWLVSGFITLQYITDVLDGAVGRFRNTGLVKWGYFMDHFLDYVFLCSVIIGYALLFQHIAAFWFMVILALGGAFMINAFLSFSATGEFRISLMNAGPTEARLSFIVFNTYLIFFGTNIAKTVFIFIAVFLFINLMYAVYQNHKAIWKLDMENKSSKNSL